MVTNAENIFDKNYITHLSNNKDEPNWMLDIRLRGLEYYNELSMLTDGKLPFAENSDQITTFLEEDVPDQVNFIINANVDKRSVIIYSNTNVFYKHLSDELTQQGVIFTTLDNAIKEYPELIKKYIFQGINMEEDKSISLHTALWDSGVFLYIPKNVVIDFPVQACFLGKETDILPHVLIVAEENSSIAYIDNHLSSDEVNSCTHNSLTEVFVAKGAKVRLSTNHNFNEKSSDYTYRQATLEQDAYLEWIISEMNQGNIISNNFIYLKDSHSKVDVKTIFIGNGNQEGVFTTKVIHDGDFTESDILFRGIMLGHSKAIFNGITKINKGANKADANQSENILMLSENARGDVNPILLIDEYDVVASHAATAGPVDEDDVYYLMSRGITKHEAERLIIHGFLAPVVSRIPIEGMKEQLEELIERKLLK